MQELLGFLLIFPAIKNNINYRVIDLIRNRDKFLKDLKEDSLSRKEINKHQYHAIFIAGLPKSGTTRIENFFMLYLDM